MSRVCFRVAGSGALLICLAAVVGAATAAHAAPPPLSVPISSEQSGPGGQGGFSGYLSSLERSNYLFGDMFGLRTALSKVGISLAIQETSEIFGNVSGGVQQGATYDGLTQGILQLDTQRAFGWYGGLFNVSALQYHGTSLSAQNLMSLQTASGIGADNATRLWELWYDQKMLPEDRLSVRIGQQSLDQEFIVNPNGAYFINTMFGWPMVPSADLPGGGPAYPLSALGVRLRYRPVNSVNILAGVFNGSPVANNAGDPQKMNPSGTSFPLNGGVMAILELQYVYPSLGSMVEPGSGAPLGHTYKIGVWYDSEQFADQRFDNTGLSLADPGSTGMPAVHKGDYSIYAVADQMIWREGKYPNRSVSIFGRAMYTPQGDRNLIDFSMNAGVVYHDPLPNRPDDTLALGMGYAHVSAQASALDADTSYFAQQGSPGVYVYSPIRNSETYLELTYQWQVRPWWQIQPDFQYVFSPGGGIVNPNNASQRIWDEAVVGVRTNILF